MVPRVPVVSAACEDDAVEADVVRWNDRYTGRTTGDPSMPKGLGGIELERGRCLDVACGLGEQSLWAARNGFEVVAIDGSDVAITALNSAAVRLGLRDHLETRVVDLDTGLPTDLAGRCALVICQRFRDPALYEQLVYMLQPNGVLVVTVLSCVGLDGEPGTFHATPGELVDAFRRLDVVIERHVELDGEATLVARRR
jgi:2-polyprenyl-3-methyl-5-hydroxy-6-metoxy-1,4-benzoquinol methylase